MVTSRFGVSRNGRKHPLIDRGIIIMRPDDRVSGKTLIPSEPHQRSTSSSQLVML